MAITFDMITNELALLYIEQNASFGRLQHLL